MYTFSACKTSHHHCYFRQLKKWQILCIICRCNIYVSLCKKSKYICKKISLIIVQTIFPIIHIIMHWNF
ncbi:377R [Invertebrate iridescent virus Kaz2018]|uniref:377R n=1 Tax=Invertebrate iridescent virus 6 TaxID=176652 RepID=Q91FE7_IIV6|nr:377R [Invertebrate iridescent virus 6]AAK82237.1 377R [Invertebrate iridescent virus 6]QMS79764.1 hypothetical protein IIV6-T1_370 [Invertebrate iridescent virus 6]QNH08787.1 377R [Invertebrate iridescent virus Kaz2018]